MQLQARSKSAPRSEDARINCRTCHGLQLLGLGAAAQNLWTAAVLLAAVTVDTVARRNRPNT